MEGLEDGEALARDGQRAQGEREGEAGWRAGAGLSQSSVAAGQGPQRCAGGGRGQSRCRWGAGRTEADSARHTVGLPLLPGVRGRPRSRGESRAAEAAVAGHWALVGRGWTRALDRGEIAQSVQG